MPRRHILPILFVVTLAALSAQASDFWIAKDWKQWSKDDCEKLLAESPWAHIWRGGGSLNEQEGPGPIGQRLGGGPDREALVFSIQLRSALPIREAIVRKLQFDQKYDKMTDKQQNEFNSKATQILNRSYEDAILIHVDFSKGSASDMLSASSFADSAVLITDDRTEVKPTRFDTSPKTPRTFDAIFPRTMNGAPIIKDGLKRFSFQFQSLGFQIANGVNVPSRSIRVDFDLERMSFAGKLSY